LIAVLLFGTQGYLLFSAHQQSISHKINSRYQYGLSVMSNAVMAAALLARIVQQRQQDAAPSALFATSTLFISWVYNIDHEDLQFIFHLYRFY